ncbi:MAG: NAD-dependent deacetylase [Candidatus Accumulibacter sp.]|jgi:NAD-dependent SIR2 family protein deacetylase|nr:NAD-dependent deacetylase [Accumulibacter sp.]
MSSYANQPEKWQENIRTAARWITEADGLLITAGAGMGVDSGLPDFRGREGFWRAYPPLEHLDLDFEEIASGGTMHRMPRLCWGFYGHRLALYRRTEPHEGFRILRRWAEGLTHGAFVFTSNVDGQFQKAGYPEERIMECHGSIHHLQCTKHVWPADDFLPEVDMRACELKNDLPLCPYCGERARPNVLMFNDYGWIDQRTALQEIRLRDWLAGTERQVVVEMGAGKAIATVRRFSERHGPRVVRINPVDFKIASHLGIGIQGGALEVLRAIDAVRQRENLS